MLKSAELKRNFSESKVENRHQNLDFDRNVIAYFYFIIFYFFVSRRNFLLLAPH